MKIKKIFLILNFFFNPNFSYQEFNLINEYLEKIEKASWQVKLSDLDTLPE